MQAGGEVIVVEVRTGAGGVGFSDVEEVGEGVEAFKEGGGNVGGDGDGYIVRV
jgi:hypothetical protein